MKKKDLINKTVIIDQKSYTSATSRFTRPTTTGKYVKNSEESVESQLSNLSTLTGVEAEETIEIQICQQLLIAGFIQSYVDFYHLTNRADPHSTEAVKITKLRTSIQDMTFIRDNLMAAETARRQGNTQGVYNAYNKLADLYASLLDWRTSVFFHEKKLLFLLIKNNKHHLIKYIYNKYPIDYKNINYKIIENPFIFEYLIKNNMIERKFLKNNYIRYVKYNIHNDDYDFYSKYNIALTNIIDNFPISNEDLPLIDIFLNYSYNLMNRLNRIAYQNIIINYNKECKYKWLKSDTFLHIKNKNEIVIEWLKSNNKIHFDLTQYIAAV
jgi:hypothetical protein